MNYHHDYIDICCSYCGHHLQVPVYCKNRFCDICNRTRRARIRYKISRFLESRRRPYGVTVKHLTLSIKNEPDLKVMVDNLLLSFRKLRQRKLWKRKVYGGAFVVEITRSDKGWHAHLHIVIDSAFIIYNDLLSEWMAVSTGRGVYIKRLPNSKILYYLTKYITKTELRKDDQLIATEALKGRRMYQPFGDWHKPLNAIKTPIVTCNECEHSAWALGTPSEFAQRIFKNCDMHYAVYVGPGFPP